MVVVGRGETGKQLDHELKADGGARGGASMTPVFELLRIDKTLAAWKHKQTTQLFCKSALTQK